MKEDKKCNEECPYQDDSYQNGCSVDLCSECFKLSANAISFDEYCKSKNITLKSWQKEAADGLLAAMYPDRKTASGKTFLINLLRLFLLEHGNNFELSQSAE